LWAGGEAAGAGRSAGEVYELEGVRASRPEIIVAQGHRARSSSVLVHHTKSLATVMPRMYRGIRVTGVEATLLALGATFDAEAFEIACEDARRRALSSMPALRAYLTQHGRRGRPGVASMRALLDELDPVHASRSTLEVKTRRLLVAQGFRDFVREYPLEWSGRRYFFDFAFERQRVILETNGRRWHDDPTDYEDDQEKWSIPARYGFKIVFATWNKVTCEPMRFMAELDAALTDSQMTGAPGSRPSSTLPAIS
jgi:very-short-patch-repair endonuclease